MADNDFVLKVLSSYPAYKMTNEEHKKISVRIVTLHAQLLNPRPHDYEAEV
jgi:hypothetical protein